MADIYDKLAVFVNRLPAAFPQTESGVELRILRKLFTEDEARLFMHLTLIGEESKVIAHRAKQLVELISQRLDEMEKEGLIFGVHRHGKPTEYIANQFVIGFWEGSVKRLDRELVEDFEEYYETFTDPELWRKTPQMRTIPIGEAIPITTEAMPYEIAEKVVESNTIFAVTDCICRKEFRILGKSCDKPLETCMSFGSVAEHIASSGLGRTISKDEILGLLKQADKAGLILQPANSKDPAFLCACCGDCCGILRMIKAQPKPADFVLSPYRVAHDDAICSGCGTCIDRCQMEAITIPNGIAEVNLDRCIGCGLCVSTCDTGAMTLVRKPDSEQRFVPKNIKDTNIRLGQARGLLSNTEMVNLFISRRSTVS